MNGKDFTSKMFNHFSSALQSTLDMTPPVEINDLFALGVCGRPATLILDHFEDLMQFPDTKMYLLALRGKIVKGNIQYSLRNVIFLDSRPCHELELRTQVPEACSEGCGWWTTNAMRKFVMSLPVVKIMQADEQAAKISLANIAG